MAAIRRKYALLANSAGWFAATMAAWSAWSGPRSARSPSASTANDSRVKHVAGEYRQRALVEAGRVGVAPQAAVGEAGILERLEITRVLPDGLLVFPDALVPSGPGGGRWSPA